MNRTNWYKVTLYTAWLTGSDHRAVVAAHTLDDAIAAVRVDYGDRDLGCGGQACSDREVAAIGETTRKFLAGEATW